MSRRCLGFLIGALAAGAVVTGPVAAADASNTSVKVAILHAGARLHRDQLRIVATFTRYAHTHQAGPVVRAITAEDRDYLALRTALGHTSASTADGSQGKRDVISGLTLIVDSNRTIRNALRRHGNAGLTPAESRDAKRLSVRGNRELHNGARLLERS